MPPRDRTVQAVISSHTNASPKCRCQPVQRLAGGQLMDFDERIEREWETSTALTVERDLARLTLYEIKGVS